MLRSAMGDVAAGLKAVRERIVVASAKRTPENSFFEPRLVAVSKTKPAESVVEAYEAGQRHFGENYVGELVEKGNHPDILSKCKEIRWHFIGHLQRNKVNKVLGVPNLWTIETVDTDKLATSLDNAWPKFRKSDESRLRIMVQINTSGEEEKNGCEPKDASSLVRHVIEKCKNLELVGLMTIGMYGYDLKNGPNPDFIALKKCRDDVCEELEIDRRNVEISMGMSNDFEHAVEVGSSNVRVGSSIFGLRSKKGE